MEPCSENKFQYQLLPDGGKNCIRVATIHPGTSEQIIQITLRHERFDEDHVPDYEALSYAWGACEPEADMARVILKHKEHSFPSERALRHGWLGVRSNLASALKQLRLETKSRDLWIDSICIDQEDAIQKGPQVRMMGNIYNRASGVIVWLGTETHNSSGAMNLMQSLGVQVDVDWDLLKATSSSEIASAHILDESVPLALEVDDLDALVHLFHRQWFDRLWIRQEIFLANQGRAVIQCGPICVRWPVFRCGWYLLHYKDRPNHQEHPLWRRQQELWGFLIQLPSCSLSSLRLDFEGAQCSDLRDRIYAIRALLDKETQQLIEPSYAKTVEDVYRDAVVAHMGSFKTANILCECYFSPQWKGPSWVPDWSSDLPTKSSLQWQMASAMISSPAVIDEAAGSCRLLGVYATTITKLVSFNPRKATSGQLKRSDLEQAFCADMNTLLMTERRHFNDPYPTGGTITEGWVRALCDGQFLDEAYPHFDLPRHDVANLIFQRICHESSEIFDGESVRQQIKSFAQGRELETLARAIERKCSRRMVMHTTGGEFPLGGIFFESPTPLFLVMREVQAT
jgi:hypothetical protein